MTFRVVNVMFNLKHIELLPKMSCICKFMSFAKTGAPSNIRKIILSGNMDAY